MTLQNLNLRVTSFDKILEFTSSVMLTVLVGLPLFYYYRLPKIISIYYTREGSNAYFADSSVILILPVVGLVVYLGLHVFSTSPRLVNDSQHIYDLKSRKSLISRVRQIRFLKLTLTSIFTYLTYSVAELAL